VEGAIPTCNLRKATNTKSIFQLELQRGISVKKSESSPPEPTSGRYDNIHIPARVHMIHKANVAVNKKVWLEIRESIPPFFAVNS
jgi:hypothetical protein